MATPLVTPAKAPYTKSVAVGSPGQNKVVTTITMTPENNTVEVTSTERVRFVTSDTKKSLNPIEKVESTA
jgi:hypothetical protein|tara:strand:+ start:194 stop:403 length:210 start_codon:yes stop_codon:yes gene_type:complete